MWERVYTHKKTPEILIDLPMISTHCVIWVSQAYPESDRWLFCLKICSVHTKTPALGQDSTQAPSPSKRDEAEVPPWKTRRKANEGEGKMSSGKEMPGV